MISVIFSIIFNTIFDTIFDTKKLTHFINVKTRQNVNSANICSFSREHLGF